MSPSPMESFMKDHGNVDDIRPAICQTDGARVEKCAHWSTWAQSSRVSFRLLKVAVHPLSIVQAADDRRRLIERAASQSVGLGSVVESPPLQILCKIALVNRHLFQNK